MTTSAFALWARVGLLGLTVGVAAAPARASEDEVIREIVQALQSKTLSSSERVQLIAELGTYGEKAVPAVPTLIEAITDKIAVRQRAAEALAAIGAPAVPALLATLDNHNPEMVIVSIGILRD